MKIIVSDKMKNRKGDKEKVKKNSISSGKDTKANSNNIEKVD